LFGNRGLSLCFNRLNPQIVIPVVVGSNPIVHPIATTS